MCAPAPIDGVNICGGRAEVALHSLHARCTVEEARRVGVSTILLGDTPSWKQGFFPSSVPEMKV